ITPSGDEVAYHAAPMSGQPVPHDQQRSGDVPQQSLEEIDHLRALHRARIKPEIEVVEGDPGHGRQHLPIETVLQNGCDAATRPGAAAIRPLAYSVFVVEDDRAPLLACFFFNGRPAHLPPGP